MPLSEETRRAIEEIVTSKPVVLFMKGTRAFPQCGFSNRVVQILDVLLPDYETVDVLADPEIREGIKEYSSWPTIPQLYVRGELVGGCDIVSEMYGSGELHQKLGIAVPEPREPRLHVSERAAAELRGHLERSPGQALHLSIDARFHTSLGLGPPQPGELEIEAGGVPLRMDPMTAARAEGLSIDFDQQRGFRIDNPNAPSDG